MRWFVAALAAVLVCPAFVQAHERSSAPERYFQKRCEDGSALGCIHRASLHWGESYSYMKGISFRESRWNPNAKNPSSSAAGLFQFLDTTWAGSWNPYRNISVYSGKHNALAAAYAMSRGWYSWWAATS